MRLRIRVYLTELCAVWITRDAKFLNTDMEDSDQTACMRRLIWVFVGRMFQKVLFLTFRLSWLHWYVSSSLKVFKYDVVEVYTVESRYLEVQGALWKKNRDIRTSTYQMYRIKEKLNWTTTFHKWVCNILKLEVYCGKEEKLLLRSNFSPFP